MALATAMGARQASQASQARVEDTPTMVTDTQDTTVARQASQARVEDTPTMVTHTKVKHRLMQNGVI